MYEITVTVLVNFIELHPFFLSQGKRSNLIYLICWHILFYLTSFKVNWVVGSVLRSVVDFIILLDLFESLQKLLLHSSFFTTIK